jgi:hypothetical protein
VSTEPATDRFMSRLAGRQSRPDLPIEYRHHRKRSRVRTPAAESRSILSIGQPSGVMDKFVRRQNLERYRRLLELATDENRREHLLKLLADVKQAQKDAGDPEYTFENL